MDQSDRIREFEKRYKERIAKELNEYENPEIQARTSRQYQDFKKDYLPTRITFYEKACNIAEKVFKVTADKKKVPIIQKAIDTCHLNCTPTGVTSLSFLVPIIIVAATLFAGFIIPMLLGMQSNLMLVLMGIVVALVSIVVMQKVPFIMANNWRMKASNQMVLCVFYVVTYMRHTSNMENAINFAAEHLSPPLAIDMKKILWDIETEKYATIKESLDSYLEIWKDYNREFMEAMHLIESSLYESSEERRVNSLDKSLSVILEETYEKMLHYAHNLQSPLTMLHMLGIVLPILGLVILPLAVSFVEGIKWYHLFALYNLALPIGVYYLSKVILSTRPTGYGDTDISNNPEIKKYKNIRISLGSYELLVPPIYLAGLAFVVLFFIGISPLLIHATVPNFDIVIGGENPGIHIIRTLSMPGTQYQFLGYQEVAKGVIQGPYGLGAAILSLALTMAFGISAGLFYRLKSKNVIQIREETKKIEEEFAAALFQLGNRLGDDLPVEIAFQKVAETMQGTASGRFFEQVTTNMRKLGMRVEEAIFDPKKGAMIYYPSAIIESAMKVLIESSKKGSRIAAQALINVSQYIKEMHRVDERLKDLMADIISSMKSQISFLTPAIAGIVIGITSMITTILGALGQQLTAITSDETISTSGSFASVFTNFLGYGIPTYYFQFIVGLYVVQIVFILSVLVNGIQNGADILSEKHLLGENLIRSTILFVFLAFGVMLVFNIIAAQIIGSVDVASLAG